MARAAQHCFAVSKPWGDTQAYDVGIEHGENFLRVQVKSTIVRSCAGYRCMFMPNHQKKRDYSLDQIDLFAAYVIPEDAWYLIPAVLLLGQRRRTMAMLCPVVEPAKKASYIYEGYREAWNLLKKSRSELLNCGRPGCPISRAPFAREVGKVRQKGKVPQARNPHRMTVNSVTHSQRCHPEEGAVCPTKDLCTPCRDHGH